MTREEKIKEQKDACKENGWPQFMPSNGFCYRCNADLTEQTDDMTSLITGCRACCVSFCS
jgi:hypothetical protein